LIGWSFAIEIRWVIDSIDREMAGKLIHESKLFRLSSRLPAIISIISISANIVCALNSSIFMRFARIDPWVTVPFMLFPYVSLKRQYFQYSCWF
jgi:hypothetical protein